MINLEVFGKVTSNTGYGVATKNIIDSLKTLDINLKLSVKGIECDKYFLSPNINLYIQCPPFKMAYSDRTSSKYKIGYFYWETDRLPRQWNKSMRWLDEAWVPCELVRDCLLKDGFSGPIEIVPTPANNSGKIKKMNISIDDKNLFLSKNVFRFYSIFQWHERKGWKELLSAYFEEFSSEDNVVLILKTMPLKNNTDKIKSDILNLKRKINKKNFPMLYLITKTIEESEINGIHKYSDCYVSPHHGEGWGMPIHDAINFKNELIITKFGGITEFLDENSANIITHSMGAVKNMEWCKFYGGYQSWANPSKKSLKQIMRKIYESNKDDEKVNNAFNLVKNFDIEGVGNIIYNILKKDRFKHL